MSHGLAILAVLGEARRKFGAPRTAEDVATQAAWVQRRIRQLRNGETGELVPFTPRAFRDDPKARAAGGDE